MVFQCNFSGYRFLLLQMLTVVTQLYMVHTSLDLKVFLRSNASFANPQRTLLRLVELLSINCSTQALQTKISSGTYSTHMDLSKPISGSGAPMKHESWSSEFVLNVSGRSFCEVCFLFVFTPWICCQWTGKEIWLRTCNLLNKIKNLLKTTPVAITFKNPKRYLCFLCVLIAFSLASYRCVDLKQTFRSTSQPGYAQTKWQSCPPLWTYSVPISNSFYEWPNWSISLWQSHCLTWLLTEALKLWSG